jgi:hypothetical protein
MDKAASEEPKLMDVTINECRQASDEIADENPDKTKPVSTKCNKRCKHSGDYVLGPYGGVYLAGSKHKPKAESLWLQAYKVRSDPFHYKQTNSKITSFILVP